MSKIGYYVHHQGDGHRQRALAIAQHAPECFTLLGTGLSGRTESLANIDLADDRGHMQENTNPHLKATHYTPLHHEGIKKRVQQISSWIAENNPALLVVDVSVEIALLARLCSTPTVYVRLLGNRLDSAHLEAFRSAEAILCPFHPLLEQNKTPQWVRDKSFYFSGLTAHETIPTCLPNYIVVALGAGGHNVDIERLDEMARQLSNWRIDVIGPMETKKNLAPNLHIRGWVNNAHDFIAKASLVIGAAGDGLMAEIMAAGKPYICLPQKRPFAEQKAKAKRLKKLGAAVIIKDWPLNWSKTVEDALKLGSIMHFFHDEIGSKRAADFLLTLAHGARFAPNLVHFPKAMSHEPKRFNVK